MNVVMMWCRSMEENIISIDNMLPWNEPEDKINFQKVFNEKNIVMGRKTYESMEKDFLAKQKIYVMTSHQDYELISQNHEIISSQKDLGDIEDDLYIAGGREVYELFLTGKEALKPEIIVDCVYEGAIDNLGGNKNTITECMKIVEKNYRRLTPFYQKGNVKSAILVRKGEFVEQSILRKIVSILENGANIV